MDVISFLDIIPQQYHFPVAVIAVVLYYGFPRFQEWRNHKRYYDAATRVLAYKKLLYEVEAARKSAGLGDVNDRGLSELVAIADDLRPHRVALPPAQRFLYGWAGSAIAFFVFTVFYALLDNPEDLGAFILGAFVLSIVAGLPTILYRSNNRFLSALFGAGAGFVITFVIGLFA